MATAKKPARGNGAKGGKDAKSKDLIEDAVVVEKPAKPKKTKVEDKPAGANDAPKDETPKSDKPKSVFMPMLLGGVLSGAIGFGAASYYFMNRPSEVEQKLAKVQVTQENQQAALKDVTAQVSGLPEAVAKAQTAMADLSEVSNSKDESLSAGLSDLAAKLQDIDARLTTLEKRPVAEGAMTSEAAAAYERELQTMRDLLATQRADIEKLAAEATARIEGVAQQAAEAEKSAEQTAKATAVKVAVAQLQSALDNGGAFEATVTNLAEAGVDVPQVLKDAAKGGVPTLLDLQETYPQAARAGLAASVKATTGDGVGDKIGAFFRSQVGARSLAPREGDDPDAVLSRAEAALGKGDIAGVIALVGALPEEGQAAMAGWVKQAETRLQAVEAVRALADSLNGN